MCVSFPSGSVECVGRKQTMPQCAVMSASLRMRTSFLFFSLSFPRGGEQDWLNVFRSLLWNSAEALYVISVTRDWSIGLFSPYI